MDNTVLEMKLELRFHKYMTLLNLMESIMKEDKIASITQTEIAKQLGVSQTNVSSRIKQLIQYGAIKKVAAGKYIVLNNDINYTPFNPTKKVLNLFIERPELFRNYKKQAEILDLQYKEVQMAWGFLNAVDNLAFIKRISD